MEKVGLVIPVFSQNYRGRGKHYAYVDGSLIIRLSPRVVS